MRGQKIPFKTLTPIWTGGVDRTSDQVHETGLIGSLRWWYEGIVRGLGGYACDPVDGGCRLDPRDDKPAEEQLCPACQLFGCTGWRRRFRLEVTGLEPHDLFFVASRGVYQAAGNWLWRIFDGERSRSPKGSGAAVTFDFGVKALWGEKAELLIVPLGSDPEGTMARVLFLLSIVQRWGGLGAKPQHGFGQIQTPFRLDPALAARALNLLKADIGRREGSSPADYFDLARFFSHRYELAQAEPYADSGREVGRPAPSFDYLQHYIPCAFDIRYKSRSKDHRTGRGSDFGMRPWFRGKWGDGVTHRLFGRSDARTDEDREAGRVHVSHLFRLEPDGPWYLKVWGHVPADLRDRNRLPVSVDNVVRDVHAFVQSMFSGAKLVDRFKREEVLGT